MPSRARRVQQAVRRKKRRLRIKLAGALVAIASLAAIPLAAGLVFALASELPKLPDDSSLRRAQTSRVYAADGSLLTTLYVEQDRTVIPLSDIPQNLRHAVIAIEDERFYAHAGVDVEAVLRALASNLGSGRVEEGGSTITQQYVKNAFLTPEKTVGRKLKEAALAYQLERRYDKDKILENYLNTIYFGHSAYGIEAAAQRYFSKMAKQLTIEESAALAGIIKAPNTYSPFVNARAALNRRNQVLRRMAALGYLRRAEAERAAKLPLRLNPPPEKAIPAPYFVEYVKQLLIDEFGAAVVFKGGLRIHTTLDPAKQAAAETAVAGVLNRPQDPSAALVALEPGTGYIRAMVGGKDFRSGKFNLAVQGRRQPGSSFKTFVLVAALEKGVSPSQRYASTPLVIPLPLKPWKVENYSDGVGGPPLSVRDATAKSINAVYARMIMQVGADKVSAVAGRLGITSKIEPYPAIALGGLRVGVSPLEMASAYGSLANNGIHVRPIAVTKVTDSLGRVLKQSRRETELGADPAISFMATDILRDVITKGTGKRAALGRPAAGKTGTTQNYRDAWFVGYTPDLSAAVWVGYPQAQISMLAVHGIRVTGGSFPAEIWGKFMRAALVKVPPRDFSAPKEGVGQAKMCGMPDMPDRKATPWCPVTYNSVFLEAQAPKLTCTVHVPKLVTIPGVVGMEATEALRLLEGQGFGTKQVFRVEAPAGEVVDQSPRAGVRVEEGSLVTLTVAVEEAIQSSPGPPSPPAP